MTTTGAVGVLIMIWLGTYFIARPLFWGLAAVFGFIAICLAMVGGVTLRERIHRPSRRSNAVKAGASEEAIGIRANLSIAEAASLTEASMAHDTRFALIDTAGDARFAAVIDGSFQVGKDRRFRPTRIEDFARAILIEGEGGRFVCGDGRKPAVLKFGGRAKEAVAYRLDPIIAARLGIPASGTR
jgi:hypothetical protein